MNALLREYFEKELSQSQAAIKTGDFERAWIALQRAHILSQPCARYHTVVHWEMLKLAWKQMDLQEIVGQLLQTAVAAPTSKWGGPRAPRTGRVNAAESMSIPEDLIELLHGAK
jgi:Protein of unknown function (DUF3703)